MSRERRIQRDQRNQAEGRQRLLATIAKVEHRCFRSVEEWDGYQRELVERGVIVFGKPRVLGGDPSVQVMLPNVHGEIDLEDFARMLAGGMP